jgi:hypothetical protein
MHRSTGFSGASFNAKDQIMFAGVLGEAESGQEKRPEAQGF